MYCQEEELRADTASQFLMRRSLSKSQILRLQTEIDKVFEAGKKYTLSCFKLLVAENNLSYSRFIVIPVKHYGNSIQRNYIRRQVREIWRLNQDKIKSGIDCVFIVYPNNDLTYQDKQNILLDLLKKSGNILL